MVGMSSVEVVVDHGVLEEDRTVQVQVATATAFGFVVAEGDENWRCLAGVEEEAMDFDLG